MKDLGFPNGFWVDFKSCMDKNFSFGFCKLKKSEKRNDGHPNIR